MKKILEKIVSISLTVVGLLFIALLFVVMFGAVGVDELDNQLVKVLVISLSAVFGVLAVIMISSSFADHDKLNAILLFKDKESATKASVSVVKSLVKKASKRVEAAKVTKVVLVSDENNNVKLIVYIKVRSNDTETVINRVRAEIMATCDKVLEYQFSSVDFKITQVKADYKPADSEIDAKVAAFQKEKEAAKQKAEAEKAAREEAALSVITEETVVVSDTDVLAADAAEVAPAQSEGIDETEDTQDIVLVEEEAEADIAVVESDTEVLTDTASVQEDAEEETPQADALEDEIPASETEATVAEDKEEELSQPSETEETK